MLIKILLVCIFIWFCAGMIYFFRNKQDLGCVAIDMNYKPDLPGWLIVIFACQIYWPFKLYDTIMDSLKNRLGDLWKKIKR